MRRASPRRRLRALLVGALPLVAAWVVAVGGAAPAGAHSRSQSTSRWQTEGRRLEGTFTVDARRATLLYGLAGPGSLEERVAAHLGGTVALEQGGEACAAEAPRSLPAARGYVRVGLAFACPRPFAEAPAELAVGAFFPVSASHTHLLRLEGPAAESGAGSRAGAGAAREAVLTEGAHRVRVGGADGAEAGAHAAGPGGFLAFLGLGAEHVLGGPDHLAFLAALLLLCAGVREAVATVTGFTLGHSATLALAVLGWIEPVRPAVEALIGFSIAFAAAEALAPRARLGRGALLVAPALVLAAAALAHGLGAGRVPLAVFGGLALFALGTGLARRAARGAGGSGAGGGWLAPALAVGFGLAHGAGFAGVLLDMEIPRPALAEALLGFNLGVEAAQLAVVAGLGLGAVAVAAAFAARVPLLRDLAASALLALGTYWFVGRALGA